MLETILSPGQWEALIHQTGDQAKNLVLKLAVYHGHIKPEAAGCPICSKRAEPKQMDLEPQS